MTLQHIFMTNTMRAGSSFFSRILNVHPNIAMSYDSLNFFRYTYKAYGDLANSENFKRLIEDTSNRMSNRFGMKIDVEQCLSFADKNGYSYSCAYNSILKQLFPAENKYIIGDKEALAWTKAQTYLDMFPEGKVIFLVRDVRDVVNSFKRITIAPDFDYLISLFNFIDLVNHARRLEQRFPDNVLTVRYEDLKTQTEVTVKSTCDFLGVDYLPEMIQESNFTDHFGKPWDSTRSKTFKNESHPLSPVFRWKKNIEEEDLFTCEWLAKKQLLEMGYTLSGKTCSDSMFKNIVGRLTSSSLLTEAFRNFSLSGEGAERFPLKPTDPANWAKDDIVNPGFFFKEK